MSTHELHDEMAAGLANRGLPIEYAERTAAELSDHHRDLVEELTTAGMDEPAAQAEASSRLGDQKTLVKKAVRQYQRRHWCGRWPLLTFLFGPVVLLAIVWFVTLLSVVGIGMLREAIGIEPMPPLGTVSTEKYIVCMLYKTWAVFLAPTALIYFLAKLASRAALGGQWTLLTATVLATLVGTLRLGFNQAGDAFFAGFPLLPLFSYSFSELLTWYASDFSQMCQFLLPLVVAGIFLWRAQQLSPRNRTQYIANE